MDKTVDNLCISSVETQDMVIVNSNPSLSLDFIKTPKRFNRQSGFYVRYYLKHIPQVEYPFARKSSIDSLEVP